ncbi:hypothetical protein MNBD_UNCLBAC01-1349 [hydrothermal vent metagenome]|uniref:Uncharacterized protein n=1 Tax=hydrothermal vent metagenome TaxID=652676 RepID=A0A3B1DMN5_9ZZZZ
MKNLFCKIKQSNFWSIMIIGLCGATVYSFMLAAPFKTLDDNHSIINNEAIKSLDNIGQIFQESFFGSGHYYRPLVSLSFMLEYHFFGLNPFYYNLTNLLLHVIIAITVFFLINALLNDRLLAFFVGILFAMHPIHWEAVANIPGRAIILSALFGFIAFLFYVYARKKKSLGLYVASLASFILSLLSKESAAMLPIILLSYLIFIEPKAQRKNWTSTIIGIIPYFFIIFTYIIFRKSLGIMNIYPWRSVEETVLGFFTFLQSCLISLRLFIFPVDLYYDRSLRVFGNFTEPWFWSTLGVFLIAAIILLRKRKTYPKAVFFFLSWFFIDLFPVSQIITTIGVQPGYISTAEHFLYTPSVGIFALMVIIIRWLWNANQKANVCSPNIFKINVAGILLFFALITVQMNFQARSAIAMFERSIKHQPNNSRIFYSLGIEYGLREMPKKAEGYFRQSLALEPFQPIARIGLGKALCDQNQYWAGIQEYEKVHHPGNFEELLENNLEKAYAILIEKYKIRIVNEPQNAGFYYSLGVMYSKTDQLTKAIVQYEKAIELDPTHKEAFFNLKSLRKFIKNDTSSHSF